MDRPTNRDLMIGDWVYLGNKYGQVDEIFKFHFSEHPHEHLIKVVNLRDPDGSIAQLEVSSGIEDIRGYPLTPEILENNGLKLEKGDIGHFTEDENYDFEIYLDEDGQIWWSINIAEYMVIKINYVHELQHILKICGIEKKIVL